MELLARSFQPRGADRETTAERDARILARRFLPEPAAPSAFAPLNEAERAELARPIRWLGEPDAHLDELAAEADEPEGECDCCGRVGVLAQCDVTGIETYACERCRGDEPRPEEEPPGPQFDAPYQPGDSRVGIFGTRRP